MKCVSNSRMLTATFMITTYTLCSATILPPVNINALVRASTITSSTPTGGLPKKYTETVTNASGDKISFEMVLIPSGKFTMGSRGNEASRKDDEGPQHEVSLEPFYLCTTETTFELFQVYYEETMQEEKDETAGPKEGKVHVARGGAWDTPAEDLRCAARAFEEDWWRFEDPQEPKSKWWFPNRGFIGFRVARSVGSMEKKVDAITGPSPIYGDPTMGMGGGTHPAIAMTWHNAMTFCRWLSMKTGKKYRLPTEAEWEYAARAGTKTAYFFGDDPKQLAAYAWFQDDSDETTHEAAKKKPNPWGLYDMLGNVLEWVYDFYSPTAYAETAKKSPTLSPKSEPRK